MAGTITRAQGFASWGKRVLEKIPGLQKKATLTPTNLVAVRLAFQSDFNNATYTFVCLVESSGAAKIWNATLDEEVTGATALTDPDVGLTGKSKDPGIVVGTVGGTPPSPTSTSPLRGIWSWTYHLGDVLVANGEQAIQKIIAYNQRQDLTGTPSPPIGRLIKSYLGRLYVAGVQGNEDKVFFSSSFTTDFPATYYLYSSEVPGAVTALAINSPSTAAGTIIGELVIAKERGLLKLTGDPGDATSTLDVVSGSVGSLSPRSFVNTDAGLLFFGIAGGMRAVYQLPLGTRGEPIKISHQVDDLLNSGSIDYQEVWATLHDGFYKLFLPDGREFWFDIRYLMHQRRPRWWGPHYRGGASQILAPYTTTDGRVEAFQLVSGQADWIEELQRGTSFRLPDGSDQECILEFSLTGDPREEKKTHDSVSLQLDPQSATAGNQVQVTVAIDTKTNSYTKQTDGDEDINFHMRNANNVPMSGFTGSISIKHQREQPFTVLGGEIQVFTQRRRVKNE